jgi:hypothetical protein
MWYGTNVFEDRAASMFIQRMMMLEARSTETLLFYCTIYGFTAQKTMT